MAVNDPKVYPVSAAFEQFLIKEFKTEMVLDMAAREYIADDKLLAVLPTAQTMAETLGEYEHGAADVEELYKLSGDVRQNGLMFHLDADGLAHDFDEDLGEEENSRRRRLGLEQLRAIYEDLLLMMLAI